MFSQKIYYLIVFLDFLSSSLFIPPQNVVYFLMLPFLVHKILTFYINGVLNCKCPAPRPKGKGGKVVSPRPRPPLPPRKYSWYSFLLDSESTIRVTVWPEGLCQRAIPVTPSGLELATLLFVAQCLYQLHQSAPRLYSI